MNYYKCIIPIFLSLTLVKCNSKGLKSASKDDIDSATIVVQSQGQAKIDASALQGTWRNDLSEDAVFKIENDSIDFFEFSPSKKYLYILRNNELIVYTDKFIHPDSIKNGSYVSIYSVIKLLNDTLILDRYQSPRTYYKVDYNE